MIEFQTIRYKNILSFGNMMTEIKLNTHQTLLIQGKNGSGKSSLLDVICFGLFGKPFRRINKPQLVNHRNKKDLLVEVEFRIGDNQYLVRRGINPQIFEIWKNGEIINQSASIKDYQAYFERYIIKFDYSTFTKIVVLGKATYISFMRLDAAERRQFIESILGLNIFRMMIDLHKKNIDDLKSQLSEVNSEIKVLKETIRLRKEYIANLENASNERRRALENELDAEISLLESEISAMGGALFALTQDIVDEDKDLEISLDSKLTKFKDIESRLSMKYSQMVSRSEFFTSNLKCPTCDQDISEETRDKKLMDISRHKEEVGGAIRKVKLDIEAFKSKLDVVKLSHANRKKQLAEISILTSGIEVRRNKISLLNVKKHESVETIGNISEEKASTQAIISQYEEFLGRKNDLLDTSDYYDLITTMLKDSGVKGAIIKKYIPIINSSINAYLKSLGFFVRFVIDDNFEEKIFSRGIDELSYFNFSEGEKLRIDIAVLLAWRDVAKLQGNLHTNLLIFDEILDGSSDQAGTDAIIDLIKGMDDTNVFVVSHSPERWGDKFETTIRFEKVGGFSKMME